MIYFGALFVWKSICLCGSARTYLALQKVDRLLVQRGMRVARIVITLLGCVGLLCGLGACQTGSTPSDSTQNNRPGPSPEPAAEPAVTQEPEGAQPDVAEPNVSEPEGQPEPAGQTPEPAPEPTNEPSTPSPAAEPEANSESVRYLALGDSYTIGESVPVDERWPVQLAERLRAENIAVEDPEIIARTGWTTDELSAAIVDTNPQGPYDLVSLLIGVNNQFRGREAEAFRGEFVALVERSIAFARGEPGRVLVLSIPDWGVTPFGQRYDPAQVAREIDAYNQIKAQESERLGVYYVDITPISREAIETPSLVAPDGLHPSGAMYARWVELALPEARTIVAQPR